MSRKRVERWMAVAAERNNIYRYPVILDVLGISYRTPVGSSLPQ